MAVGIHSCRVDARHIEDVLEEPRQAIEFLKRQLRLRLSFLWRQRDILKIRDGGTNGRDRGSEIVAEGGKERRRKVGALTDGFSPFTFGKKVCTLDRDRDDTAEGIERPQIELGADGRQNSDRLPAQSKRNERR